MTEVSQLLEELAGGEPRAADRLLPIIYGELRRLAQARLRGEGSGQTLQPTDLVHEAYLRLVRPSASGQTESEKVAWNSRGHFFGAAAEAMRRILVEAARRKNTQKHGGQWQRVPLSNFDFPAGRESQVDLLALDEVLNRLASIDPQAARVVELRYFAGMTIDQTASALDVSPRTVKRDWSYAKAWLRSQL